MVLAESFLQHGAEALSGGDRQQIVVHVDECTLRHAEPGRCELDDGPALPIETARRISCDASIINITEDERGEPLDVGRKTRSIPPSLRRALASRDKGCVFPGLQSQAVRRWSPHPALGRGRRDETLEPGHAVPVPSPRGARRRLESQSLRRRRVAVRQQAWEALFACAPGHTQPLADWTDCRPSMPSAAS